MVYEDLLVKLPGEDGDDAAGDEEAGDAEESGSLAEEGGVDELDADSEDDDE